MQSDPLSWILAEEAIATKVTQISEDLANLYRTPSNINNSGKVSQAAMFRALRAITAFSGGKLEASGWAAEQAVTLADPIARGNLRLVEEFLPDRLPNLISRWLNSPLQVLTKWHILLAKEISPTNQLGKPREDFMQNGRLAFLMELITGKQVKTGVSLAIKSAIVHAELVAMQPFNNFNEALAFYAGRLTRLASSFDPKNLLMGEEYFWRTKLVYQKYLQAYTLGSDKEVIDWVNYYLTALLSGITAAQKIS